MSFILGKGQWGKKVILTVILCLSLVFDNSISAMAANYPNSSTWGLHFYRYDSKLKQTVRVVSSGNGYYATCTEKNGDCSYNVVSITSPTNTMTTVSISEKNIKTYFKPSSPYMEYVDFEVTLSYANGDFAYNGGTIERK